MTCTLTLTATALAAATALRALGRTLRDMDNR